MPDFRDRAACRDAAVDPEWFFPTADPRAKTYKAEAARAKAVCGRCLVRSACLEAILAVPGPKDKDGITAGLDPEERDVIRVRRANQADRTRRAAPASSRRPVTV